MRYQVLDTDNITVNIGPQHPSSHGGLRVETVFDGERIVDSKVHLGYVHRSVEKIAESKNLCPIYTLYLQT